MCFLMYNCVNLTYIIVSPYCPMEQGACSAENGGAQNSGKIELKDENNGIQTTQEECLEKCKNFAGATGCEVFGISRRIGGPGTTNRKCYVHTNSITSGNGEDDKFCWVFSNCDKGKMSLEN